MNFQIRIFKDRETLSRAAADLFAERAAESIAERGRFLVALNGGGTPSRLFQLACGGLPRESGLEPRPRVLGRRALCPARGRWIKLRSGMGRVFESRSHPRVEYPPRQRGTGACGGFEGLCPRPERICLTRRSSFPASIWFTSAWARTATQRRFFQVPPWMWPSQRSPLQHTTKTALPTV